MSEIPNHEQIAEVMEHLKGWDRADYTLSYLLKMAEMAEQQEARLAELEAENKRLRAALERIDVTLEGVEESGLFPLPFVAIALKLCGFARQALGSEE